MNDIIKKLEAKQEHLQRQIAVLTSVIEVYQSGIIQPGSEYSTTERAVYAGIAAEDGLKYAAVRVLVPEKYAGRNFRVSVI